MGDRPDECVGAGTGLEGLVYRLNCKALSYTWREAIEDCWWQTIMIAII